MENKKELGGLGEAYAARYLQHLGHRIIVKNYTCRQGEIDIISLDEETLVFTEVRVRSHKGQVSSEDSITPEKQRRIRRAAEHYLVNKSIEPTPVCRFDVIALTHNNSEWKLRYYIDAF